MSFYRRAIEELSEGLGTVDTTEKVRELPTYRAILYLRKRLFEGGVPMDLATRVASAAEIGVPPEAAADEGFWPLVDKLVRFAVLVWETLVEDLGACHAETIFSQWGKQLSLKFS